MFFKPIILCKNYFQNIKCLAFTSPCFAGGFYFVKNKYPKIFIKKKLNVVK
jgi:hypothetical protein